MYMYASEHKCVDKSNFSQLTAQQHGSSSATGLLIVHEQRMSEWLSTTGEPTGGLNPQRWRNECPKGLPTREPAGGSSTRGPCRVAGESTRREHTQEDRTHRAREQPQPERSGDLASRRRGSWLHQTSITVDVYQRHRHHSVDFTKERYVAVEEHQRWLQDFDGYADCCFNVGLTDQTNMTRVVPRTKTRRINKFSALENLLTIVHLTLLRCKFIIV